MVLDTLQKLITRLNAHPNLKCEMTILLHFQLHMFHPLYSTKRKEQYQNHLQNQSSHYGIICEHMPQLSILD